jgi:hypothetical protein
VGIKELNFRIRKSQVDFFWLIITLSFIYIKKYKLIKTKIIYLDSKYKETIFILLN